METKNVFVSHYHEDSSKIVQLKKLIEKQGNYRIKDSSIYETKEKNRAKNTEYIKTLLRPKIDWAGTVIVLIGPETSERDWVNWEIDYAGRGDKKIIGVLMQGVTDDFIPEAFKKHGTSLVGWNSKSINDALQGTTTFENADGNDRAVGISPYRFVRYGC